MQSFDGLKTPESVRRYSNTLASFLEFLSNKDSFKEDPLSEDQRNSFDKLLDAIDIIEDLAILTQDLLQPFLFSLYDESRGLLQGSQYAAVMFLSALLVKKSDNPRLLYQQELSCEIAPIVFLGRIVILSEFISHREYVLPFLLRLTIQG